MTSEALYGASLAVVIGIMAAGPVAQRSRAGRVRSAEQAMGPILALAAVILAVLALNAGDSAVDPVKQAAGLAFGGGVYLACLLLARPPGSRAVARSLGAFIIGAAVAALPLAATAAGALHAAGFDEGEAWRLAAAPGTAVGLLLALAAGHALGRSGVTEGYPFAIAGAGTALVLEARPGVETVIAAALVVVGAVLAAVPERYRLALALAGATAATLAVTYNQFEKGVTG